MGGSLRGRPVVALCPYVVEGLDAADAVDRFTESASCTRRVFWCPRTRVADLQASLGLVQLRGSAASLPEEEAVASADEACALAAL